MLQPTDSTAFPQLTRQVGAFVTTDCHPSTLSGKGGPHSTIPNCLP